MRLIIAIIHGYLIAILAVGPAFAACVADGANWASTPDYASVAECVTNADRGDTITVSAGDGTETWASTLNITKSLSLIGPGSGSLTITSGLAAGQYLINITPATIASDTNELMRISGFTFAAGSSGLLTVVNASTTPLNKLRIDHNAFTGCLVANPFLINGTIYGVIDNNTFTGYPHFDAYGIGSGGQASWAGLSFTPGTANNLYFEDNTITIDTATSAVAFHTGGHGGRYASRYNTYRVSANQQLQPWFDVHGNMNSGIYGTMGAEQYGNALTIDNAQATKILSHRGGIGLNFYNQVTSPSTATLHVMEEWDDKISNDANACANGDTSCSTDGQYQRVTSSYYWGDFLNTTLITAVTRDYNDCALTVFGDTACPSASAPIDPGIAQNTDYFVSAASFDGTAGVGCGTLAARPATCTAGVGYWATDQSCSDLTGLVGVGATPLAGTLYKCTATNTWSAYYTPYSYPHPLRGETTTRTITSSKVGAVGTLSYEGESIVNDGDNSQIYTAANIPNGWKVTWSGTGGCTGNGTTCQVLNVTGDVTVIATFTEIKLMPW